MKTDLDAFDATTVVRPRRRRRAWIAAVTAAVLVVGTVWVLDQRTKATPFGLDSARELHREAGDPPTNEGRSSEPDAGSVPSGAGTVDPRGTGRSSASGPGPVIADTGPAGVVVPAAGVYTYATKGGDKVSMLGARHDYPSRTHAVVTSTGACGWRLEQRVVEEHVDTYDWCSSVDGLHLRTLRHDIEFFAQRDSIEHRCPVDAVFVSPADAVGAKRRLSCETADGDELDAVVTVTARESRTVGGTTVPTIAYRADFVLTGKATGTARWDGIVHAETGLRLREHRVVSTDASAIFGNVHYEEDVTFELVSLDPTG